MSQKQLKPIQKELLRFFKEFKTILDENKIEYVACGGTMIGAVREKGFIPWDDDIDLFMTRPNYDKLMDLARKNDGKINGFDVACGELNNSLLPFCKVFDKRYRLNAKGVEGDEDYLFLDIFPLDAVPDNIDERKAYYKEIEKRRKRVAVSRLTYRGLWDVTKNKALFPAKVLVKFINKLYGDKRILNDYIDFCKKYNNESCSCVWDNTWGNMKYRINLPKADLDPIDMPFEDTKMRVMRGYDAYLTAIFGDYMKRPKVRERETHEIEIIKER